MIEYYLTWYCSTQSRDHQCFITIENKALQYNDVFKVTVLKIREELGITQEALAERSGLSRAYISRLERGINQPKLITVFKISAGFGIEASALIDKMQTLIDMNSIVLN